MLVMVVKPRCDLDDFDHQFCNLELGLVMGLGLVVGIGVVAVAVSLGDS